MREYVGIPYLPGGLDRSGLDCWGLVRLVYRDRLGVELPSFAAQFGGPEDMAAEIAAHKGQWLAVDNHRPLDLLLLRINGLEKHVAVVVKPGEMLHALKNVGVVRERYDTGKWRHRVAGAYRYAEGVSLNGLAHPLRMRRVESVAVAGTSLEVMIRHAMLDAGWTRPESVRGAAWVDGELIPQGQWPTYFPAPGAMIEFRLAPADGGIGRIVATLAVIAISVAAAKFTAGASLFATGGALAGFGTVAGAVVGGAAMMAGTMLTNAIFPVRPPETNANNPGVTAAQNILSGAANAPNQFGAIPVVLGQFRYSPPLAAHTYSETTATKSFLRMALCWGFGPLQVQQIRVGDTPITTLEECEMQTMTGDSSDTAAVKARFDELYGASDVVQDYVNKPLIKENDVSTWVEHVIGAEADRIAVTLHFPEGLRAVAMDGGSAGKSYPTGFTATVQYRPLDPVTLQPSGDWLDVTAQIRAESVALSPAWVSDQVWEDDRWVHESVPGYRIIRLAVDTSASLLVLVGDVAATQDAAAAPDLPRGARPMWSILVSGAGVVSTTDQRGTGVTGCAISITGLTARIAAGQRVEVGDIVRLGREGEQYCNRKDAFTVNVTQKVQRGRYMVRVRRDTASESEYVSSGGITYRRMAACRWIFATGYLNERPVNPPMPLAMTALRIRATDQLDGNLPAITGLVTSICPDYDRATGTWIRRATRNPASLYRYVRQHPANAKRCTDAELDLPALEEFHEFCRVNRFTYDNVIADFRSVQDVCRDICAAGRATPHRMDGKWSVVIDKPRSGYAQMITPANSWGFEGVLSLPQMPHGLRVQFRNRYKDYAQDELVCYVDGYTAESATLFESITLPGVTDPDVVYAHARFHLGQLKLRPERYALNMDFEHLICTKGDLVRVSHDVPMWGVGQGRLKNRLDNPALELDNPVLELDNPMPMQAGERYTIRIRRTDTGATLTRTVSAKTSDGYYQTITLEQSVTAAEGAPGNLFAFGRLGLSEGVDLVVESIEPADNATARLTLVDYAPDIYNLDDGPIPPHDSQITLPQNIGRAPITARPVIETVISDERALTYLADGQLAATVQIAWRNPAGVTPRVNGVEAQVRPASGDDDWTGRGGATLAAGVVTIRDVEEGEQMMVRLRYVATDGQTGPWSDAVSHTVVGQTSAPSAVTGLAVTMSGAMAQLDWADSPELDVAGYEVRLTDSGWGEGGHLWRGRVSQCQVPPPPAGTSRTWYVRAFDLGRRYSRASATIQYSALYPLPPSDVRAQAIDNMVQLSWLLPSPTTLPVDYIQVRRGATFAGAVSIGGKSGTFTTIQETVGGTYTYWLTTVDTGGAESTPVSILVDVDSPSDFVLHGTAQAAWTGQKTNARAV